MKEVYAAIVRAAKVPFASVVLAVQEPEIMKQRLRSIYDAARVRAEHIFGIVQSYCQDELVHSKGFRVSKIVIACCLILVSLWALLLPPLFPASSRSLVNARGIEMESVLGGVMTDLKIAERQQVTSGEVLGTIRRDRYTQQRDLDKLSFDLKGLEGRLAALDIEIDYRKKDLQLNETRFNELLELKQSSLTQRKEGASEKVAIYEEEVQIKRDKVQRLQILYDESVITEAQWMRAREEALAAEERLITARQHLESTDSSIMQMKSGIADELQEENAGLLSRIDATRQEVRDLKIKRLELESDIATTKDQIQKMTDQVVELTEHKMISPVDGVIWRKSVVSGQDVLEGQSLFHIANDNSLFVEAFFGRHFLETVSLGDRAHVYLLSEGRFVEGVVTDIQAQEQASTSHTIINSLAPDPAMLRVLIEIDEGVLDTSQIGHLAKVMISEKNPNVLDRLMVRLSFLLRSNL